MYSQEEIKKILRRAASIDSGFDLFGSGKHRYMLNPPIDASFVRSIEEKYSFTLPDDYFSFITETGDGGAGPEYGIYPFAKFMETGINDYAREYYEAYRNGAGKPFAPRPMADGEAEDYGYTQAGYDNEPEKFFVFEKYCEEENETAECSDGFFVIGTHGCQWDFGIITAGDRRGQIFDSSNEGAYYFLADSFSEFYQGWLDSISDEEEFRKEIKALRKQRRERKKIKLFS